MKALLAMATCHVYSQKQPPIPNIPLPTRCFFILSFVVLPHSKGSSPGELSCLPPPSHLWMALFLCLCGSCSSGLFWSSSRLIWRIEQEQILRKKPRKRSLGSSMPRLSDLFAPGSRKPPRTTDQEVPSSTVYRLHESCS